MDIRNLIRENIRNLAPYSTARDDYQGTELSIALDANENPYDNGVNRYPDPRQKAAQGTPFADQGRPGGKHLRGQRLGRTDRFGLQGILRTESAQRRSHRPDLQHVQSGRRNQRRGGARSTARGGFFARRGQAARRNGCQHPPAVALFPEQPDSQQLPHGDHRTDHPRIRRNRGARRSVHRLRRRAGLSLAPRRISEPDRTANALEGMGHGGFKAGTGLRRPADRRYAVECQVPLQRERSHTADRPRTARRSPAAQVAEILSERRRSPQRCNR